MLDRLTIERMTASGDGPIVVGLSGGGDSVALLHLLAEHFSAARLRAVIVDHALRSGSEDDAARAHDIAAGLGVAARIRTLSWPGQSKAAQGAARIGRYRALCEQARAFGARTIAVAHTRDDQAETVLLRAARGSTWRGLAGMRAFTPAPIWPEGRGLWLARPLLGARRAELRRLLGEKGAAWIEDPANASETYARVRARRWLGRAQRAGFDPMRLARLAERLAPFASAQDTAAARLINSAVIISDASLSIAMNLWRGPVAIRKRALSALLTAVGGQEREPPPEQVATLNAELEVQSFSGATLAGAWLKRTRDRLTIRRDPGALAGRADGPTALAPLSLAQREALVWDNRVEICVEEPGWTVVADRNGPWLKRGADRRPLAATETKWLLQERVRHLLGGV